MVATRSPAPMPVAATTRPGPMIRQRGCSTTSSGGSPWRKVTSLSFSMAGLYPDLSPARKCPGGLLGVSRRFNTIATNCMQTRSIRSDCMQSSQSEPDWILPMRTPPLPRTRGPLAPAGLLAATLLLTGFLTGCQEVQTTSDADEQSADVTEV